MIHMKTTGICVLQNYYFKHEGDRLILDESEKCEWHPDCSSGQMFTFLIQNLQSNTSS